MGRIIPDKVSPASRNGLPPVACVFLELGFLCRIDLVADDAGQHCGVLSLGLVVGRAAIQDVL